MTLARGIAMPRGPDNATCHTQGPDTRHLFFFSKNLKKLKNHRLTRGTLTNDIIQLVGKGPN